MDLYNSYVKHCSANNNDENEMEFARCDFPGGQLSCPICYNTIDNEEVYAIYVFTECTHWICLSCFDQGKKNGLFVICPMKCRIKPMVPRAILKVTEEVIEAWSPKSLTKKRKEPEPERKLSVDDPISYGEFWRLNEDLMREQAELRKRIKVLEEKLCLVVKKE